MGKAKWPDEAPIFDLHGDNVVGVGTYDCGCHRAWWLVVMTDLGTFYGISRSSLRPLTPAAVAMLECL